MLLRTFGGLTIEIRPGEANVASLGPRRLAMLAVVAAAGPRGISREKILGILWAETDEEQARHTLSQTLYVLRRDTGQEVIAGTTLLRLHESIACDLREFEHALNANDLATAVSCYTGPFLEGFYLAGAPEFEQWVEETRSRLRFAAIKALEALARQAVEAGSFTDAIQWWRRLCEMDPLSAQYAAGQIQTLIALEDYSAALRVARDYEAWVRRELDSEPDPTIRQLTATLRTKTAATVAPRIETPALTTQSPAAISSSAVPVRSRKRTGLIAASAGLLMTVVIGSVAKSNSDSKADAPFLAIGSIQSRDTAALGPLLRDMLATNLARIDGVQVVSNSRLLELLARARVNNAAATTDAARRAGANEIVEGELGVTPTGLVLTLRRVAIQSGVVRQGYSVRAADLYALTDSATSAIARDLRVDPPPDPVATVRTNSAIAYALYEEGLRSFYGGDAPTTLRFMKAALVRDSTFAMAAYYAWLTSRITGRWADAESLLPLTRRLATRTVGRERLLIEARITDAPVAERMGVARQLTTRFPGDPDGHIALGTALSGAGDWAAAVTEFDRAIAIDSISGAIGGAYCRVCEAIGGLALAYSWWDSTASAERSIRRLIVFRPEESAAWGALVEPLLRQGRRTDAEAAIAKAATMSGVNANFESLLDRDLIRAGRSDELEARLVYELSSAAPHKRGERPWLLAFSLRNQGRLRDAQSLAEHGMLPGIDRRLAGHQDALTQTVIAFERGQPGKAARGFLDAVAADHASSDSAGTKSRMVAWHMTLAATALAAAGDTAAVRALADSVQRIGSNSSFGRDPKLHHFLRGLLFQRENRHAEAVEAFRQSLYSLTDGYTRTNLELAKSLMTLRRYPEAIAVLQPALRGGVDGSNSYVTHTELHEALAQAFERAGQPDSAAVHWTVVERSWRRADPEFADRYRKAKARSSLVH